MPFLVFSSTKYQPGIFFGMLCGGSGGWRGKDSKALLLLLLRPLLQATRTALRVYGRRARGVSAG